MKSCKALEFLPYHRLGAATYGYTQREYPLGDLEAMTSEEAAQRVSYLTQKTWPFAIEVAGKVLA